MTEFEQSNGSSTLRRLMPRVFSRASAPDCLSKLLRTVRGNHPKSDLSIITEAYRVAEHAHRDQTRRSGEPYITHPIAVAQILADLGVTPPVVAAALLHDTVEDTDYTLEELTEQFGDEIALLVDGVTKLDKVQYGDSAQAETVRKMIVAMTKDIRVLVIKLADRLHNARTERRHSDVRFRCQPREIRRTRHHLERFVYYKLLGSSGKDYRRKFRYRKRLDDNSSRCYGNSENRRRTVAKRLARRTRYIGKHYSFVYRCS